jgi:hypothetical protein
MEMLPENPCADNDAGGVDDREGLWNDGPIGPISQIQLAADSITSVLGILFDLDPKLNRTSRLLPAVPLDPAEFYEAVASKWLSRHPVLAKAEVRNSGTGLHAILRFDQPVIFNTSGERDRWTGIVKVVQAALPIDPDQPGLIATTRPIGSVNAKNGATVTLLTAGEPVTESEVRSLFDEMVKSPFRTVMRTLIGSDRATPCPICGIPDSHLSALDFVGKCYGGCGKVSLTRLYDGVLRSRDSSKSEACNV